MKRFRVTALPASEGDCLVISYGPADVLQHIVVDAGRKGNASTLAAYLDEQGGTRIELLIVTHIDADHIEGMLDFLGDHPNIEIDDIWFNGYQHLRPGLNVLGPVQGEKLTTLLHGRNWNAAFGGKSVMVAQDGAPIRLPALPGGMVMTILSPDVKKLAKLEPVWASEVRKQGLEPGHSVETEPPLPGLEVLGANLVETAATATLLDKAEANGSSIALLAEYEGKRVLLGADAHSDLLCQSFDTLADKTPYRVDLYKAPHHGSQANNTQALLGKLRCSQFLISTSGAKFKHPDTIAIARMIVASHGPARLHFNYRQPKTEFWHDRSREEGELGYECFFPEGDRGISVELL